VNISSLQELGTNPIPPVAHNRAGGGVASANRGVDMTSLTTNTSELTLESTQTAEDSHRKALGTVMTTGGAAAITSKYNVSSMIQVFHLPVLLHFRSYT